MLAPTPPMGWNSWNTFGGNIHESLVRETADAFVSTGLQAAGYQYVVIDDGWQTDERGADERLVADPAKFPGGIKVLSDYVHSKGLKFGIYSCAGSFTCMGKPASYGYEEIDARTFAEWGVDFLKYDFCYKPAGAHGVMLYARMGQELRAAGRPILYNVCEWGINEPWKWAASVGAHMWRTTSDIADSWESIEKIGFGQASLEAYAGPDHWNDPDMLTVGMYGSGNVAHGGCTDEEYRTHFSLWCLLASPLMLGCDVRKMNEPTRAILLNPRLIAINQDPLGRQGFLIERQREYYETWMKPLADGSVAVGLFNRDVNPRKMIAAWASLRLHDRTRCEVVDAWSGESLGVHDRAYAAEVPPHGVKLFRITPMKVIAAQHHTK